MCWWCDDVKKTSIFEEVKNRPKTAILIPFSRTLKNDHFWPFFVCWRVLTILWRADKNFDGVMISTTCDATVDDEKKVEGGKKKYENDPQQNPIKNHQNGARHGRRETAERKGHKERLWRDRVRMVVPDVGGGKVRWKPRNGTSSASVVMCEAFLDRCVAYSHDCLTPRGDSWKQARTSAAKCVRVSQKSVRIFLIRSFMTTHRLVNRHTRP
jgi:hypothetical protein